jgi:hypothetical protein
MFLVTGWLKTQKSRTIVSITEKHFKYCHEWCMDKLANTPEQGELF